MLLQDGPLQRLRGAVARDHPAGALARGLPPALFHEPRGTAKEPRRLSALLQRAPPSGLPPPRPDPGRAVLGRRPSLMSRVALGRSPCQHHFESGHPSPCPDAWTARSPSSRAPDRGG